jgi:1-phosphatidylinositol-3-phosphate 5-kinase
VKKIISHLVFVAYNWRLERSFHIDSFAMPPEKTSGTDVKVLNSPDSNDFVDAVEELSSPGGKDEKSVIRTFDLCLDDVILSASPFITYPIPYLETEIGKHCELRRFFPQTIYWSIRSHRSNSFGSMSVNQDMENNNSPLYHSVYINSKLVADKPDILWESAHLFTTVRLTCAVTSDDVQGLVADFRRKGTRLTFSPHCQSSLSDARLKSNTSSWNTLDNEKIKPDDCDGQIDALDPFKHQRLSLLFCSYSPISANAPYFCVNPW